MVDKILKRGIRYKIALAHDPSLKLSDLYIIRLAPFVFTFPFVMMYALLFNKSKI
jgi:hypothetical protein